MKVQGKVKGCTYDVFILAQHYNFSEGRLVLILLFVLVLNTGVPVNISKINKFIHCHVLQDYLLSLYEATKGTPAEKQEAQLMLTTGSTRLAVS